MKIIFDERPGEIYDLFASLWIMNNIEDNDKTKEEYGVYEKNQFEEAIINNIIEGKIDKSIVERYFYKEMTPEKMLSIEEIWKHATIDKYLDYIRNLDELNHTTRMYNIISSICANTNEKTNDIDNINIDDVKEKIIKLLVNNNISVGLKWEGFLMLRDIKEYMEEYMEFIDDYIKVYNKISSKRKKVLKKYNEEFKSNIEKLGLDFLKKEIDNTFSFEGVNEIRITTTALVGLRILEENGIYYVIIGPYLKKFLINRYSDDDIEKNLNFIRSISETTRFKIIKLLLKRDHYGQEIVDALKINKATTFYHLDYLLALKVVNLSRESQKNYYSLNLNEIMKNIDVFKDLFTQS